MVDELAPIDLQIARVASAQHGVVTTAQLVALGLSRAAISKRARAGRLHRLHRGVYAVGHLGPSRHRTWTAAVLACGEGAVLSHGSAAALWELLRPIDGPVDVTIPTHTGRARRRGIRIHRRGASLSTPGLQTRREGIPVTSVARTIEDLHGAVAPRLVRRAIRQAEFKGVRLDGIETNRTRSDLEEEFLRLRVLYGLPVPEVNAKVGRWEVDFLWREQRLAVEIDSFVYHRGSVAFQEDRARDLDLRSEGFAVHRFSERQLEEEPGRVVADVVRALDWRFSLVR